MNLLVAYDIINNRRRHKLSEALEKNGVRINKSVFLFENTKLTISEMNDLIAGFSHKKDSIYIFAICDNCLKKSVYLQQKKTSLRERITKVI